MKATTLRTVLLGCGLAGLLLQTLRYPEASLAAGLRGLSVWWDVLFPSLFPFFVISDALLGFGVVHLFGTLLDPLMRPLFRIPGSGGFVAAMGYVSGYPVGARLTAKLREQNLVTREEGERLVAFTTSSDPIFLLGAVSVGFFHDARLGLILAVAHYGGGLLVGLLMSLHGRGADRSASRSGTRSIGWSQTRAASDNPAPGYSRHAGPAGKQSGVPNRSAPVQGPRLSAPSPSAPARGPQRGRVRRALSAMAEARRADGRSFGEVLTQAVQSSLRLMVVVGGLVVFFTVLMELLRQAGILPMLYKLVSAVLSLLGASPGLAESIVSGTFEVTLGASAAGGAAGVSLPLKAAAAAFVLSWGGLSVHAQVASILHGTGLRYLPFMLARLVHAVIAAALCLLLWKPLMHSRLSVPASVLSVDPELRVPWLITGSGRLMIAFLLLLLLAAAAVRGLKLLRDNRGR